MQANQAEKNVKKAAVTGFSVDIDMYILMGKRENRKTQLTRLF